MAEGRRPFLHFSRGCLQRLGGLALLVYFVAGLAFLGVREGLLPQLPAYRSEVAQLLSEAIGLPVEIGSLSGEWRGFYPRLQLGGLLIRDAAGEAALSLERVEAEVAWSSLLRMRLRLHRLEIVAPDLAIRRLADGRIFVAGLPLALGGGRGDFAAWLLDQRQVEIRHARLAWSDALREAPPLVLEQLDFRLDNVGTRHRFGLHALPPARLAAALDVRGELKGSDPTRREDWQGELYAGLDYADLGAWRPWVDYPLAVNGAGGVRAWLELEGGALHALTADFALRDTHARLARELDDIPLARAAGRLRYREEHGVLEVSAKHLSLQTLDGLQVAPTDFFLRLAEASGSTPAKGEFVANQLDLDVLARLAGRLPLPATLRQRLAELAPQGSIAPLSLKWSEAGGALQSYAVDGRFSRVGIAPIGAWPGFSGLSGQLEGNERGGRFTLSGRDASLALPQIFPAPRLLLAELAAEGSWSHPGGVLEVSLASARFANADTRGSAAGRYRASPDTPGEIDLTARLSEADSTAVWRYLPTVIGQSARDWVQRSLIGGKAVDTRLVLKGPLASFPFRRPGEGTFRVSSRIVDGQLDYAAGWPKIEGISGELLFEGAGMRIKAHKGRIFGAALSEVSVQLPDFEHEAVLSVRGNAHGPTQDFLRFIAESPVAESINRFTDPFRAEGTGGLALQLVLPLHQLSATRVRGEFQFTHNQIQPDTALPLLADASGRLAFSETQLSIKGGTARVFGDPVSVVGGSRPDGSVLLNLEGSSSILALRRELELPLLDHLSGSAPWKGTISVPRRGGVEFALDSNLLGVSSSLPDPFNKSAQTPLPFHFELLSAAGVPGDTLKLAAGGIFQAHFLRRQEGGRTRIVRGGMALNEPIRLADKGVLVAARAERLDADAWRSALAGQGGGSAPAAAGSAFPLSGLALRAGELRLLGQRLNDVSLRAVMEEGGWQARLGSKEASGEFVWREQGRGRLQARFRQLALGRPGAAEASEAARPDEARLAELPGLDISADSFSLRGHQLGRLELKAANRGETWRLEQFSIINPDGTLRGDGSWRPGPKEETRLNFRLDVASAEKMLARLGYPEAVRRGKALLEGEVAWHGAPTALHLPSLEGKMHVEVDNGQFTQLDPGVGRLLGVLNLQALPRRITLDFRDVFSQGFAFDRISGSIQMNSGVLRTEDLTLFGPAARVFMRGDADAVRETQHLRVQVQPTLSESIAVGSVIATTGAVHPVLGVATYLVQKVLRDPVEKLFSFEYAVTGSWSDPKVDKLGAAPAAAP